MDMCCCTVSCKAVFRNYTGVLQIYSQFTTGCKTFSTSRFALQDLQFDYFTKINVGSGTDSNDKDRVFA